MGLGLATIFLLSRYLGVERFGKLNYIFAFFYFFLTLSDFGINTVLVREISRDRSRAESFLGGMLSFKALLAAFSILTAWAVISRLGFERELRHGLLIYALALFPIALQLPSVIYTVLLKIGRLSFLSLLNKGIGFILLLAVIHLERGLAALSLALVLGEVLFLLILLKDTRQWVRLQWRLDPVLWGRILRSSIPLGVTGLFVAVVNGVDFILLERLTDLRQVGLFSAAHKVTNLLEALPLMVMGTLYPVMSRYAKEDPGRLQSLYRKSALALGGAGVAIGITVTFLSPIIIRLLFGSRFAGAEKGLAILIWSTASLYPAICGGNLLISLGMERINLWINASAAVLNLGMNLLLIPRFGFVGAAVVSAATYCFIMASTGFFAHQALRK